MRSTALSCRRVDAYHMHGILLDLHRTVACDGSCVCDCITFRSFAYLGKCGQQQMSLLSAQIDHPKDGCFAASSRLSTMRQCSSTSSGDTSCWTSHVTLARTKT